jgi:hypothetical protein
VSTTQLEARINVHYFQTNMQYFLWKNLIWTQAVLQLESISNIRIELLITCVQLLFGIWLLYLLTAIWQEGNTRYKR